MRKLFFVSIIIFLAACNGGNKKSGSDDKQSTSNGHKNEKTSLNAEGKVTYFDACADIKINNVTMDFWPSSGNVLSDPKEKGKQFVRVELSVTSVCDKVFPYNYTSYKLKGSDGNQDGVTMYINDGNAKDIVKDTKDLKKGESVTTALYFEVAANDKVQDLTFVAEGYDATAKSSNAEIRLK